MMWVNDLSKHLYDIMKSGNSVDELEGFAERSIENTFEEIARWMMRTE